MKKFGRNQLIALASLTIPFAVGTVSLYTGKASFVEWSSFVQTLIPWILGISLGASAVVKGAQAVSPPKEKVKNE